MALLCVQSENLKCFGFPPDHKNIKDALIFAYGTKWCKPVEKTHGKGGREGVCCGVA